MNNELVLNAIGSDMDHLAHYGLKGQKWYVNQADRFQYHAKYAKGVRPPARGMARGLSENISSAKDKAKEFVDKQVTKAIAKNDAMYKSIENVRSMRKGHERLRKQLSMMETPAYTMRLTALLTCLHFLGRVPFSISLSLLLEERLAAKKIDDEYVNKTYTNYIKRLKGELSIKEGQKDYYNEMFDKYYREYVKPVTKMSHPLRDNQFKNYAYNSMRRIKREAGANDDR